MPLNSHRTSEKTAAFGRRRSCIYVSNPFTDCYCMNITGMKIPRMLDYCAGDYVSCPIYRNRTVSGTPAAVSETLRPQE